MPLDINGNIINATIASILPYKSITTRGLVLYIDSVSPDCYPGSGTSIYDLSGQGNTGTLVNGATVSGGSINFVGSSTQYINVPHSTSLNLSTSFSVGCWVYYQSGSGRIIQKDDRGVGDNYTRLWELGGYNGTMRIEIWHSDGNTVSIYGSALTVNGWMHLAYIFDGSSVILYQNGSSTNSTSFSGDVRTAATPITIGGGYSSSEWFTGYITGAYVYNRPLGASEVLQNYNAQKSRFGL
jgi:hypothetical protein